MDILFVAEGFGPNKNANGNCVFNVAKAMQSQGHKVHILTKALGEDAAKTKKEENISFYWYRYDCDMTAQQIKAVFKNNIFKGAQAFVCAAIGKIFFKNSRINPPGFFHGKIIENAVEKHLKNHKYHIIIAASFPLETAVAIANLKQKNAIESKFYFYQLDSYVENYTLVSSLKDKRIKLIEKIYKNANAIVAHSLLKPEIAKVNEKYLAKTRWVEYPTFVARAGQDVQEYYSENVINCAYFGSLYGDIRNPDAMLNLFCEMPQNVHLHIFGNSNEKDFESWQNRFKNRLHFHGEIPAHHCLAVMQKTNILVNLGNSVENQLPSKIFQYFAACRPIVNIVQGENCATICYMNKYPTAVNLYQSHKFEENANKLFNFVKNHGQDSELCFEDISQIYKNATPEYVANVFVNGS